MAAYTSKRTYVRYHWTIRQRLDHYTDKSGGPDACWPWLGSVGSHGYGQVTLPMTRRQSLAHRVAWEVSNGLIPDSLFVCHHCDFKRCVNPSHLFVGTPADNMIDKVKKGRGRKGPPMPGSQNPSAKLTEADVRAIRSLKGTMPQRAIAARFGVHISTVEHILCGSSWRHLI